MVARIAECQKMLADTERSQAPTGSIEPLEVIGLCRRPERQETFVKASCRSRDARIDGGTTNVVVRSQGTVVSTRPAVPLERQ
jgi:hypothetical protein